MRNRAFVGVLLSLAMTGSAVAQPASAPAKNAEPAAVAKDRREPAPLNEIEHGISFGATAGWFFLVNPPATSGARPFSTGQHSGVEVGYDVLDRLWVGAFVLSTANRIGAEYTGTGGVPNKNCGGEECIASGDLGSIVPGAGAKFGIVGFDDSQDVKRTWIYVRGGVGYVFFVPRALVPGSDVFISAGPGVEYFTRLRHFSVGLEATGHLLPSSGTLGFAISPNLRYAF